MKSEFEFESSGGAVSTVAPHENTNPIAATVGATTTPEKQLPAACHYPRTLEDSTRPFGVETQTIRTMKTRGESRVRYWDRCVFSKRAERTEFFNHG